jgi:hypothetical protein
VNHVKTNDSRKFLKANESRVIEFAQHVKTIFKRNCPGAVCCPVLRVDVFESQSGKLLLNELESLEALADSTHSGNKKRGEDINMQVTTFRIKFFENKLDQLIKRQIQ